MKRAYRRHCLSVRKRKLKSANVGKYWHMSSNSDQKAQLKKRAAKAVRSLFMREISSCKLDDLRKIVRNDYRCTRC